LGVGSATSSDVSDAQSLLDLSDNTASVLSTASRIVGRDGPNTVIGGEAKRIIDTINAGGNPIDAIHQINALVKTTDSSATALTINGTTVSGNSRGQAGAAWDIYGNGKHYNKSALLDSASRVIAAEGGNNTELGADAQNLINDVKGNAKGDTIKDSVNKLHNDAYSPSGAPSTSGSSLIDQSDAKTLLDLDSNGGWDKSTVMSTASAIVGRDGPNTLIGGEAQRIIDTVNAGGNPIDAIHQINALVTNTAPSATTITISGNTISGNARGQAGAVWDIYGDGKNYNGEALLSTASGITKLDNGILGSDAQRVINDVAGGASEATLSTVINQLHNDAYGA
jgi:hypothetical protein